MNTFDLRLLRLFLALMSERSVSRAAERVGMSQPAASHALGRLRILFDDPLLLRSNKTLVPTQRAIGLQPEVERLVAQYDRLVAPPRRFDPASSLRTFVLTAPEFGELMLVPHILRMVRTAAPGVRIEVRAPNPAKAFDLLESGEVDIRIAWLTSATPSMRTIRLFEDRLVCIADERHPGIRDLLTLDQFVALPHARTLGTSNATTGRVVDEALAGLGRKLERSFLVQHFLTIPPTLVGTDIIATLPLTQARAFAEQHPLRILEPPLRLPRVRYGAYWHERSHQDPGHRWLRRLIETAAATVAANLLTKR